MAPSLPLLRHIVVVAAKASLLPPHVFHNLIVVFWGGGLERPVACRGERGASTRSPSPPAIFPVTGVSYLASEAALVEMTAVETAGGSRVAPRASARCSASASGASTEPKIVHEIALGGGGFVKKRTQAFDPAC